MILSMHLESLSSGYVWLQSFVCILSTFGLLLFLVQLHQRVWATYDLLENEIWDQQTAGADPKHATGFAEKRIP